MEITAEYLASQGLSPTFPKRFWKKVDKNGPTPDHKPELGPCWTWIGSKGKAGYGMIVKGKNEDGVIRSHRASWILNTGPIPVGILTCHHCDNPSCVNPVHLFLGTDMDNARDAVKKGRIPSGAESAHSILNDAKVKEIRRLHKEFGTGTRILSKKYSVSRGAIKSVIKGVTWKHVV